MKPNSFSEFALSRVWRNESTACRHHYITCGGKAIPTIDN